MVLKRKLFLMDDYVDLLEMISEQLEEYFDVTSFSEYAPAHEYLTNHAEELDIVISDFKMPIKNGLEILSLVKELNPKTIRIILTGFAFENDMKEGKEIYHAVMEKNNYQTPADIIKLIQSVEGV